MKIIFKMLFLWNIRCNQCNYCFTPKGEAIPISVLRTACHNCGKLQDPDLKGVIEIHCLSVVEKQENANAGLLLAETREKGGYYINYISVNDMFRRSGLARRMLKMFLEFVGGFCNVHLRVVALEPGMTKILKKFYKTVGFVSTGKVKNSMCRYAK